MLSAVQCSRSASLSSLSSPAVCPVRCGSAGRQQRGQLGQLGRQPRLPASPSSPPGPSHPTSHLPCSNSSNRLCPRHAPARPCPPCLVTGREGCQPGQPQLLPAAPRCQLLRLSSCRHLNSWWVCRVECSTAVGVARVGSGRAGPGRAFHTPARSVKNALMMACRETLPRLRQLGGRAAAAAAARLSPVRGRAVERSPACSAQPGRSAVTAVQHSPPTANSQV